MFEDRKTFSRKGCPGRMIFIFSLQKGISVPNSVSEYNNLPATMLQMWHKKPLDPIQVYFKCNTPQLAAGCPAAV
jgi:hypothetical protein